MHLLVEFSPSVYINDFKDENPRINKSLNSHFIDINGFGIESDDYEVFLQERSRLIFSELKTRIELTHSEPKNEESEVLILGGESDTVEFKSTLRYDIRNSVLNKKLEYVIAKTIAAFLNGEGGSLLIGVDDEKNILGLENDFSTLRKPNIDGFELQLLEVIKKYIGVELISHLKITFPVHNEESICLIIISKSSKPLFTKFEGKEDFFIRAGGSSVPLSREEQSEYEKNHWK